MDLEWMREYTWDLEDPDDPRGGPRTIMIGRQRLAVATNGAALIGVKTDGQPFPAPPTPAKYRRVRELLTGRFPCAEEASLSEFRAWLGEPVGTPAARPSHQDWVWIRPGVVRGVPVSRNRLAHALHHLEAETVQIAVILGGDAVAVDGEGWRVILARLVDGALDDSRAQGVDAPAWHQSEAPATEPGDLFGGEDRRPPDALRSGR